jgi:hypothetical protein
MGLTRREKINTYICPQLLLSQRELSIFEGEMILFVEDIFGIKSNKNSLDFRRFCLSDQNAQPICVGLCSNFLLIFQYPIYVLFSI